MKISLLTLFPEVMSPYLSASIPGRAQELDLLSVEFINIRDFSHDKHSRVDDAPFGGGSGMVMTPQPLFDAIASVKQASPSAKVIYLSPGGATLTAAKARALAQENHLAFVCGHYEGVDQRVLDACVDEEISIGDYVLTGGELPALVVVDAVIRFIPGVLGNATSHSDESFEQGTLEYPQYTRPAVFRGLAVPEILLSGHHAQIESWRREQSLLKTQRVRPDLLSKDE